MLSDDVLVLISQYFFKTIEDVVLWQQVSERFEKCGKRKESVKYLTVKTLDFDTLLKTIPYIQKLDLGNKAITDLGPLVNLFSLKTLDISYTKVTDLGPLEKLHDLKIYKTKVTDLGPLEKLHDLKYIGRI